ncbi:hypothetical protein CAPTEDRAFT_210011 [Capitella teleta]|uniref:Uncharacterized protein n=1 Tax=Capitella teleta TaxID=283909 RepID=R7VGH2_CAPTE|nr:hypothetical protein CAPTEDRAFT_210011 [Capitella teleta]|eukprot:ELU14785.1 hypothetical protein CAPTEDRAFT_210011 [Capitella teleta]
MKTFVVEDHDEALKHIYRQIGAKQLSAQTLTLLHFDSHPDLLIPKNLAADSIFNKEEVIQALSIENWILPAVYAGHISTVIWVRPPWSHQLRDGSYSFSVGEHNNSIRCCCSETYFLSEALFIPENQLSNKKTLTIHVVEICDLLTSKFMLQYLRDSNTDDDETPSKRRKSDSEKSDLILDIDLDYFSTTNPFKSLYSETQYRSIQKLYSYTPPISTDDVVQHSRERALLLAELSKIFDQLAEGNSDVKMESSANLNSVLQELVQDITQNGLPSGDKVDWRWLHEVGSGCDDTELPHHISTQAQIETMVDEMCNCMMQVKQPGIVTIARSSDDDYCPKNQVDDIQSRVIAVLVKVFGDLDITFDYTQHTSESP